MKFVAIGFTRHDLAERLQAAGHDPNARTTWIWEGVVMYLTPAEVENTLSVVAARSAPKSCGSKSSKAAASVSDRQTPHLNRCSWHVSLFGEQHELSVGLPTGFYAQSSVRDGSRRFRTGRAE